jgi:eukaryotic-like serine/threonine-protein kinase
MRSCPHCFSPYSAEIEFCGIDGTRLQAFESDPLVGQDLDRYRIVQTIGDGAMARVYRARHKVLDREYAVKVLFGEIASDKSLAERFRREAQVISKLNHPNIVSVIDFGTTTAGLTFLTMELVVGRTLREIIKKESPFQPVRALAIARQIAAGLTEAHKRGFVHRDLKPSNVMLIDDGGVEKVKILDFGLVRAQDSEMDEGILTRTGQFLGTPIYMSPEQIIGAEITPAADMYALGIVLFEMLEGRPPFKGKKLAEIRQKHLSEAPPPVRSSLGLEQLVKDLLEKDVAKRPQNAREVVDRLDSIASLAHPVGASRPPSHAGTPPSPPVLRDEMVRTEVAPAPRVAAAGPVREKTDPQIAPDSLAPEARVEDRLSASRGKKLERSLASSRGASKNAPRAESVAAGEPAQEAGARASAPGTASKSRASPASRSQPAIAAQPTEIAHARDAALPALAAFDSLVEPAPLNLPSPDGEDTGKSLAPLVDDSPDTGKGPAPVRIELKDALEAEQAAAATVEIAAEDPHAARPRVTNADPSVFDAPTSLTRSVDQLSRVEESESPTILPKTAIAPISGGVPIERAEADAGEASVPPMLASSIASLEAEPPSLSLPAPGRKIAIGLGIAALVVAGAVVSALVRNRNEPAVVIQVQDLPKTVEAPRNAEPKPAAEIGERHAGAPAEAAEPDPKPEASAETHASEDRHGDSRGASRRPRTTIRELEQQLNRELGHRGVTLDDLAHNPNIAPKVERWRSAHSTRNTAALASAQPTLLAAVKTAPIDVATVRRRLDQVSDRLGKASATIPEDRLRPLEDRYLELAKSVTPRTKDEEAGAILLKANALLREIVSAAASR